MQLGVLRGKEVSYDKRIFRRGNYRGTKDGTKKRKGLEPTTENTNKMIEQAKYPYNREIGLRGAITGRRSVQKRAEVGKEKDGRRRWTRTEERTERGGGSFRNGRWSCGQVRCDALGAMSRHAGLGGRSTFGQVLLACLERGKGIVVHPGGILSASTRRSRIIFRGKRTVLPQSSRSSWR